MSMEMQQHCGGVSDDISIVIIEENFLNLCFLIGCFFIKKAKEGMSVIADIFPIHLLDVLNLYFLNGSKTQGKEHLEKEQKIPFRTFASVAKCCCAVVLV